MIRLARCVPCLCFLLALGCASFAARAQASGPLSNVSSDALLAIVGTLLFGLVAGYTKGQERRITVVEIEQRQIQTQMSLFRETVLERHPSRAEMNQLRSDMREGFDEVKSLIRGGR